ncbi:hypothetical protein RIF29_33646 [Crotalaria pallida]|uniref:DUF8039 domain-containing protein n=1 Tax=Crotalaria pallida TaxID=3830 RepID=A0AAN9EDX7_CROPI
MAPKKSNDSIPNKTRKRGERGRTFVKSVIQERSRRNALLKVEWNRKGQPINDNASRFTSYIGLVTRLEVSILVPDCKDPYHDEAKEEIWQDMLVGAALNRHRHYLSIHVQNGCVEKPPKNYVDIISEEDWLEFVKYCNVLGFLEISAANKVRGSKAGECPSRISRKLYAKLEQENLTETQSEEQSLPRHRLFRTTRLDKNGRTNNPKALLIIKDITMEQLCTLAAEVEELKKGKNDKGKEKMENSSDLPSPNSIKDSCTPAINLIKTNGYMYNLEGDMLHGKELPQHHLRVSINFIIDENAPLPIENEMDNLFTVGDALKLLLHGL